MAFRRGSVIASLAVAAVVLVCGSASAQVQTSAQQGCINTMNKSGQKVVATQGKDNSACVKDAGASKLTGMNAEQCLYADRKGKVAGASAKTVTGETSKCTETPSFGFTTSSIVNGAAIENGIGLVGDVFGTPLTTAILLGGDGAKCQAAVSKAYEKYAATFLKEYNSCKKSDLKDEAIISNAGLEACVGSDLKNKISGAATKVTDAITKSCDTVALATAFPGECAGDTGSAASLSACIANAADCRMCLAINAMDGTARPCDTFDDGVQNGSCTECGNGVLDEGEGCDDGGTSPGDGCDAGCGCEAGSPTPPATCQDAACPTSGELVLYAATTTVTCANNGDCAVGTCDTGLSRCVTETELDTGWYGLAHDSDINDQVTARGDLVCNGPFAGGPEPCGVCAVVGIDSSTGQCRCSNDSRMQCDEPFESDLDDCSGEICNCYFGPPLPLSSGNVPACVVNRFAEDVAGTANVDTGEGVISARLASVVFLGENLLAPCPYCDGDLTVADGIRDGTCILGVNAGLSCDVDAPNASFPAPGGNGSSLDCFPDAGKNVSGSGLKIALDSTTGAAPSLAASIPCGTAPFAIEQCPCGVCTLDAAVTCTSNADCTGVGVCAESTNINQRQNFCNDSICTDVGGGQGTCLANVPDLYCDGITKADGAGFVQCLSNADCAIFGPSFGDCALSSQRDCFLDPITATGVQDPNFPVAVATFCIAATSNGGINTVAGLPGPGRVKNVAQAETFCASNPAINYTPGVGGCP
jgi:cysteine-rich repeat protein